MVFEVPVTASLWAYVADTVAADSQGDGVCSREVSISVFCHSKDIFPCVLLCISNSPVIFVGQWSLWANVAMRPTFGGLEPFYVGMQKSDGS